jgi:predicted aldo/keto reductase-like oxidoreductase
LTLVVARAGYANRYAMGFEKRALGRTGFSVAPLGLASGYGTDAAMVEEAVDHGVNYLYWGAWRSKRMAEGIRKVSKIKREDLIIVVQSMARTVFSMSRIVRGSLRRLGVDYLDVLLIGMGGSNKIPSRRLVDNAYKLKDKGLIRSLGISSHHRLLFCELEKEKHFDIFHIRYNAAHRGAEREVLSNLPKEGGPGVVSFTNTRWGSLLNSSNIPFGDSPPTAVDCYRFVLSHPGIHVAVCGPNSMEQLKEDLRVLELGPMKEDEMERMRRIGDHVYRKESPLKAQFKALRSISLKRRK